MDSLDDRILLMVDEGKNIREMADAIGKSNDPTLKRIRALVDQGYLVKVLGDGQARPYALTDNGRRYLTYNGLRPTRLFE